MWAAAGECINRMIGTMVGMLGYAEYNYSMITDNIAEHTVELDFRRYAPQAS